MLRKFSLNRRNGEKEEERPVSFAGSTKDGTETLSDSGRLRPPSTVVDSRLNSSATLIQDTLSEPDTGEMHQSSPQTAVLAKKSRDLRKLFNIVEDTEPIFVEDFVCALQKDALLVQGKLYISDSWICFHSNILGYTTTIKIPSSTITTVEKKATALVIPNSLQVNTADQKYVFTSFLRRDEAFAFIELSRVHSRSLPSEEEEFREADVEEEAKRTRARTGVTPPVLNPPYPPLAVLHLRFQIPIPLLQLEWARQIVWEHHLIPPTPDSVMLVSMGIRIPERTVYVDQMDVKF
ncbi:GRAM-domain-containing protein [Gonapodya prolifera JEL478]|uniref:GRAM-domain-containing protein n=1 Tax=Gonapodya prolifera (strain JEL478) TaxID=1344416 RepID=A0A139AD28_GONPJ|nr:GRAM-domain-containing protein [Gonapodya prolifera JEL478]|eukprot:KXS14569.1 GRAM-domain-containing protein [Gonapodya prolifera JEL478]